MKHASKINPLANPVAPGEIVKAGERFFWADTDMKGKWRIYEIPSDACTQSDLRRLVAESIDGQVQLCAWLQGVS